MITQEIGPGNETWVSLVLVKCFQLLHQVGEATIAWVVYVQASIASSCSNIIFKVSNQQINQRLLKTHPHSHGRKAWGQLVHLSLLRLSAPASCEWLTPHQWSMQTQTRKTIRKWGRNDSIPSLLRDNCWQCEGQKPYIYIMRAPLTGATL